MKSLVGTWRLSEAATPGAKAFRITYRLVSADTALVEVFGDPAKQVTETVFHLDGDRLMATHYCAQGNQPRLRLRSDASNDSLAFEFFDATNLKSARDSHLVRLTFRLVDANRLVRQEVYSENGVEDASTLLLERAR